MLGTHSQARVFAALELPPELCDRLAAVVAPLEAALPRGAVRWARAAGMHLTLKFYGDVASARLPELQTVLGRAAETAAPMALELQALGAFPNLVHPRVVWIGAAGDLDKLRALQRQVEEASTSLGFKPEARAFAPHLTLGRVKGNLRSVERQALAGALAGQRDQVGRLGGFTANTLSLMRSDLRPTGAEYTRLFAALLSGRAE